MFEDKDDFNRKSLMKSLVQGKYSRAEEKITDNLDQININISELNHYYTKIVNKKDKKELIKKGNKLIETTGKYFEDTFILIEDFKTHKFISFTEKLKYLKLLDSYEKRCSTYQRKFNELSEKLTKFNINQIESFRKSKISSRRGTSVGNNNDENEQYFQSQLMKGYEFIPDLDDTIVEERGKQIDLINKITKQMNDYSEYTVKLVHKGGETINQLEDNINNAYNNMNIAKLEIQEADDVNKQVSESFFNPNRILIFLIVFVGILFIIAVSK